MEDNLNKDIAGEKDSLHPWLGSWKRLYIIVLANLAILIIIFYLLTQYYS